MTDLKQLLDDLIRCQIELWNAADTRLRREIGEPFGTYDTLRAIAGHTSCRVHDLARDLVITIGGASKAVDRAEAKGLCARRANPEDRRSSIVELTAEGARLLDRANTALDDELRIRIGSTLSADDLVRLHTTLGTIRGTAAAGSG